MSVDFMIVNNLQGLQYYSMLFVDAEYKQALNLFHYTNASNKDKIIKENCIDLRLTRADIFEDKMEGQHIIKVFRDAVDECLSAEQIDGHFRNALLSSVATFCDTYPNPRDHYVFCFSKSEHNDYLIQNYACRDNRDGIVIGFQALEIESLDEITYQGKYAVTLVDVLYDENSLSKYMQHLVRRMYQLRSLDDEEFSLCKKIAVNQLAIYSLAYKSSKFKNEEETRLIVDSRCIDPQSDKIIADKDSCYIHVLLDLSALYHTQDVKPRKADFREASGIEPNAMTKPRRTQEVSLSILNRICKTLEFNIGDITDFVPEEVSHD